MALTSAGREYKFFPSGEYDNREAKADRGFRSKGRTPKTELRGKVCPGCGMTRSLANKCECNS